ncbi:MAG: hypothetical protein CMH70_05005 [Nitrosomonadaceae bacterium]|nr:hypothetical protein [Nitrosomonadaceae bacterium]|tara:strand:- start:957 stop:2405 length:1449 start_codon:yes stop_codon:yes gene_type:complete
MTVSNKVLFVKPPDRFLDNEFVYQQLGPHYLQSYLRDHEIESDMLILSESPKVRDQRKSDLKFVDSLSDLNMLLVRLNGDESEAAFNIELFAEYDIVAMSVMSPQAPDAYRLVEMLKRLFPHIVTVIGGSHARYYLDSVKSLPSELSFDFIVPNDGWKPMLDIASLRHAKSKNRAHETIVMSHLYEKLSDIPAPTRPAGLMKRYQFNLAGVPAFHTITALGCPFTCHFCESGKENLRKFSVRMIDEDLSVMSSVHDDILNPKKGLMIFDDVGLMNPKQVATLSQSVKNNGFDAWRAFSHAYLIDRYGSELLSPFYETNGRRIGMGMETGSQRSLDLLNKRNGQKQSVDEHYRAVDKINSAGIAVDAFTMIYPWEDENDLSETTRMIEFIANNPVKGVDLNGRPLINNVDSTIMTPYQGTVFNDMLMLGKLPGVEILNNIDPGLLFYKGKGGGSGWPYKKTVLPKERYEEVQEERLRLRAKYR